MVIPIGYKLNKSFDQVQRFIWHKKELMEKHWRRSKNEEWNLITSQIICLDMKVDWLCNTSL